MRISLSGNTYIRRALIALLIFLTALFQHSGIVPTLFSAPAMLLVPLTVCVAMYERSIAGMCFGTLAGLLWDFASARGDGFFAVILTAAGFFTGALVTFIFRNNIRSALLLSFTALSLTNISYWLMFIFRKGYEGAGEVLRNIYIPSIFYSLIFTFLFYYSVRLIHQLTAEKPKYK